MKKVVILMSLVAFVAVSCKTSRKATTANDTYQTTLNQGAQAKVFSVPEVNNTPPTETNDTPITIRKEDISFTKEEDESKNESNNYFVIIGSFNQLDNAKNYRQTLVNEGFTPIILQNNDSGHYRVCVNSFKDEMDARVRVHQIRRDFPKYYDTWLLIKE